MYKIYKTIDKIAIILLSEWSIMKITDHHHHTDVYVRVVVNGPMLIIQQWKVCLGTRGGLPKAASIGRRRPSTEGGEAKISRDLKRQDGGVGVNARSGLNRSRQAGRQICWTYWTYWMHSTADQAGRWGTAVNYKARRWRHQRTCKMNQTE